MGFGKALLLQAREKSVATLGATSAAKAGIENKPLGAALKRCATQNHGERRLSPQPVLAMPA
jgi:hypothetical protein